MLVINTKAMGACYNQWKPIHNAYRELYSKLPKGINLNPESPVVKIARMPGKDCYKKEGLGIFLKAVGSHSKKIGLLLPTSGRRTSFSNQTLSAMRRFAKRKSKAPVFLHKKIITVLLFFIR